MSGSNDSTDPYNHLNFSVMSSRDMPGGKLQIVLAASPTHDLVIASLTDCSKMYLLASEIEWSHCLNLTVSFSCSEPENHGMPGILLRNVVPNAPGMAGIPA